MKVAYIAGPFRSSTHWGVVQNVRAAELVALKYWKLGYAVICPHTNTANFDGAVANDSVWLEGDKEILRRCDVLVAMSTWEQSSGARAEVLLARALGMEVVFDTDDRSQNGDKRSRFENALCQADGCADEVTHGL